MFFQGMLAIDPGYRLSKRKTGAKVFLEGVRRFRRNFQLKLFLRLMPQGAPFIVCCPTAFGFILR